MIFQSDFVAVMRRQGWNVADASDVPDPGLCLYILGTNDAYVTIALAKEKYQTSVKEKVDNPEWHEECDL